jgi:hypothetical protein
MTYNEIWAEFTKLTPAEQGRFMDSAKQLVKWTNASLRAGAKVSFTHSKTGQTIKGVFVRMKQKYAEVEATQDRYGPVDRPVRWSVPPDMLRVEQ